MEKLKIVLKFILDLLTLGISYKMRKQKEKDNLK